MSKPDPIDNRKADVGDKVGVLEGAKVHYGVVHAVQYEDGDGDASTTWDHKNFTYIVHIGDIDTGRKEDILKEIIVRVKRPDLKTGKLVEVDAVDHEVVGQRAITEPVYINATDDTLKV